MFIRLTKDSGYVSLILMISLIALAGLTVWYLRQSVDVDTISSIDWNQNRITDQENREVVGINAFLDEISVSPDASFGTSDAITKALLSPDGKWIVIGIEGGSHEFGWLYSVPLDNVAPVVFQFEGEVEPLHWRSDSQYVVFKTTSPKNFTRLKLVDIQDIGEYPSDTGFTIQAPLEKELGAEQVSYEFVEWKEDELCFRANETTYCIDPESRDMEEQ